VILSTLIVLIRRSPSPNGLLLWCVVGFCAGIGLFIYGFRLLQRRRLILDTPFSKIRSAAMGMVEVSGQAVGPYTMVAPITARPCYYYRTQVWEWKQHGKNKQWVKVASECMHVPFFVDDNTGRLLIDPRGADLDLHRDFEQEFCDSFFTTKQPAPPNVHSFLARHGVATSNKIKVEECCIKPKNSLFILGTLGENPSLEVGPQPIQDDDASRSISAAGFSLSFNSRSFSLRSGAENFRTSPTSDSRVEVIRLTPESGPAKISEMNQQQKIAAALLKAGIASPRTWAAAGVSATSAATPGGTQVLTDPGASSSAVVGTGSPSNISSSSVSSSVSSSPSSSLANGFDPHPPVALMKGINNKTFLISWRSQQEVARSLGWKCTLMIWGGPALALLSLYFFLGIKNLF
jgi:hypothetical protein